MAIAREELNEIFRQEVGFEFSHIPVDEKEISIHFSDDFTVRMDKLLVSQKKSYWKYINTFSKRVVIACFAGLLLFTTACSVEEIREPIVNFAKQVHKSFVQYFVEGETVKEITCEYQIYELPEGFEQTDVNRSNGKIVLTYKNIDDEMIKFSQMATETLTHFVDGEHGKVSIEKIGTRNVEFYEHTELITAIWTGDGYFFELTYYGDTSKEQVKNLILSIKETDAK